MTKQITNRIMMIRPANFGFNTETSINNSFQTKPDNDSKESALGIHRQAIEEFDTMVEKLRAHGVEVVVIEDTVDPVKPDAIFPNNWISFHSGEIVITYPMFAENRRIERREDIVDILKEKIGYTRRYNFEFYEDESLFLEGTGSMILDREHKIVYACISPRTDIKVLEKFCVLAGYRKVIFFAYDDGGEEIYHTNVMMGLGTTFVVICMECITDDKEKAELLETFERTGKDVIDISLEQVNQFAGNMLQVQSVDGSNYLVMSDAAYKSLTVEQIEQIKKHTQIISSDISTIEKYGGGSVRCMMAELF